MPAAEIVKNEKAATPATAEKIRTVTLPVVGMTCAACQSHVERALRSTAGVRSASVNLLSNSARITFDPTIAKPEDFVASVRESGYDAALPADSAATADETAADEGP